MRLESVEAGTAARSAEAECLLMGSTEVLCRRWKTLGQIWFSMGSIIDPVLPDEKKTERALHILRGPSFFPPYFKFFEEVVFPLESRV